MTDKDDKKRAQIGLRVPTVVHDAIREAAYNNRRSINAETLHMVEELLVEREYLIRAPDGSLKRPKGAK